MNTDEWMGMLKRRLAALEHQQNCNANEMVAAFNLNRVLSASKWCADKDFVTGGMAVDNQYLYILYKILDSGNFTGFLDIGMGQTSKMISQYIAVNEKSRLTIVEDDKEWIHFFSQNIKMNERIKILNLDCELVAYKDDEVMRYKDFTYYINGKYDYISVDAPKGRGSKYSRVDILEMLPKCLKDSFVIMLHDTNRTGEQNTADEISDILSRHNIHFEQKNYFGTRQAFSIIASYDYRFFCTV